MTRDYAITQVLESWQLLDQLVGDGEAGVTDLARELSMHKNKAFRHLRTLVAVGVVEQTREGRYRMTPRGTRFAGGEDALLRMDVQRIVLAAGRIADVVCGSEGDAAA